MLDNFRRRLVAAVLAVGVILGVTPSPVEASQSPAPMMQTVQYYGPGPGYYRGPPRGYYGRPYYGRRFYGPRPGFYGPGRGFYGRRHYGRRFYGNAGN